MTRLPMVDTHAHVFSDNPERYPFAPAWGTLPAWVHERPVSAATLLRFMAEAGVDKAALVQAGTVHSYDNSYVADMAIQHPDRFVAVCGIESLAPDASDQIAYWTQERGAAGIRLIAPRRDDQVQWLRVPTLWERAQQLELPVAVLLIELNQAAGIPVLKAILEQFPETTLLLDHTAHPVWEEGPPLYGMGPLLELARFPGVRIKFTTISLDGLAKAGVEPRVVLPLLVERFGAHRIMWGSDVPNSPGNYTQNADRMRAAVRGLPLSDQEWILSRTALTVYPRLA